MGAATLWTAALAALAATATGAPAPRPGALETYRDWTIGCDNRGRCEAVSLLPQGGEWPDEPVTVAIARDAGADADPSVWVGYSGQGLAQIAFLVDGRAVATAMGRDGEALLDGRQGAALAVAIARGATLEIRNGAKRLGRPSLSGSGAALRYMDARQGRAGTTTALIATGPLGKTAIAGLRPAPAVRRAPVPIGGVAPVALWREELTSVGKLTGCADEMQDADAPAQYRLSKTETLILAPCGAGAYNVTSVPVIATGVAGRRVFRFAAFDYKPGWGDDPKHPMLVNALFDARTSRLQSYAKGRGLGDCGGSESYVWDGAMFRLVEATAMGECRGSAHWITTWSARVVE
jgi:hypothetical protein